MEDIGSEAFKRLSKLTDDQWSNILLKLRLHAEHVVRRKKWKAPEGMLPKGFDAASLASEAVCRLLAGDRKWNPEKVPDVLVLLKGTVDSIASKLVEAPEHEKGPRFAQADEDPAVAMVAGSERDQQKAMEDAELRDWIWSQAKDEEEQEVLLYLEEGCKPAEIADQTGKPVERIYQVLRNLKRRLDQAYRERA